MVWLYSRGANGEYHSYRVPCILADKSWHSYGKECLDGLLALLLEDAILTSQKGCR